MAKIYVTIEVNANNKLEATAIVRSLIKNNYKCNLHAVSTDDPYKD